MKSALSPVSVLFIGDIVGPQGTEFFRARLPELRAKYEPDVVIVDADNCDVTGAHPMGGSGLTAATRDILLSDGIDLITLGAHAWDAPDAEEVLSDPRVLRAHNAAADLPGCGFANVRTAAGVEVSVLVLASPRVLERCSDPWSCYRGVQHMLGDVRLVHYLSEGSFEKRLFAHAAAGAVDAVIGTWSHEPTTVEVMDNGTALVCDVGATGPYGGIGGFEPDHFVAVYTGTDPNLHGPYRLVTTEQPKLGAVFLTVTPDGARTIERVA